MRYAIPALAGFGLALVVAGLPPLRVVRLADRVTPYLRGLDGTAVHARRAYRSSSRWSGPRALARFLPGPSAALRERLREAGATVSAETYRVEQAMWAAAAAIGAMAAAVVSGSTARWASILALLCAPLGAGARDRVLAARIRRRRQRVSEELPVALDLLTLSVMAGEAIPAAFDRVGRLLQGEVGAEFRFAFGSMRAGTTLEDALGSLPARLPHPGVARVVDALCDAVERGAPVAEALRAQADDLREARRRHLMEVGGRREVAMLVPVVFLILPTLIVFTLLPGLAALDLLVP